MERQPDKIHNQPYLAERRPQLARPRPDNSRRPFRSNNAERLWTVPGQYGPPRDLRVPPQLLPRHRRARLQQPQVRPRHVRRRRRWRRRRRRRPGGGRYGRRVSSSPPERQLLPAWRRRLCSEQLLPPPPPPEQLCRAGLRHHGRPQLHGGPERRWRRRSLRPQWVPGSLWGDASRYGRPPSWLRDAWETAA